MSWPPIFVQASTVRRLCVGWRSPSLTAPSGRTGNASDKFRQLDRHVVWRLKRLLIKKRGRNLRAGQAARWNEAWFHDQGLHQLMGTVRYPKAA
jgi:hypothetical protein